MAITVPSGLCTTGSGSNSITPVNCSDACAIRGTIVSVGGAVSINFVDPKHFTNDMLNTYCNLCLSDHSYVNVMFEDTFASISDDCVEKESSFIKYNFSDINGVYKLEYDGDIENRCRWRTRVSSNGFINEFAFYTDCKKNKTSGVPYIHTDYSSIDICLMKIAHKGFSLVVEAVPDSDLGDKIILFSSDYVDREGCEYLDNILNINDNNITCGGKARFEFVS